MQLPSRRQLLAKVRAEKAELASLKAEPHAVDANAESLKRLQALRAPSGGWAAAAPSYRTAQDELRELEEQERAVGGAADEGGDAGPSQPPGQGADGPDAGGAGPGDAAQQEEEGEEIDLASLPPRARRLHELKLRMRQVGGGGFGWGWGGALGARGWA